MKPELDRVYVYDSHGSFSKMMVKGMKSFPYMQRGILHNSELVTVYRYALDVTVRGIRKTLLMVSLTEDPVKVNSFLESASDMIDKSDQFNIFSGAHVKPLPLSIVFT